MKLAAYPYRIYLGNIDSSKIVPYSLDFYDVFEKTSSNYLQVEEAAMDYVKRTLEKRIEVFTDGQIELKNIFDLKKAEYSLYIKTLFYASSGIPRCLGYILNYCYLSSINQGDPITIENINTAAKKYFTDNILPDFYNDVRFKQSFYDDKEILSQIAQKNLMDKLIEQAKSAKRKQLARYSKNDAKNLCKQIFIETIKKYKKGIKYWLPTSHFFVEKEVESILQTLELYFIVSKYNEGSCRKAGIKAAYYGLNYGLCLENNIDYGKPEFRRSYDYWRQDEFDYTIFIQNILKSFQVPICNACGYIYEDESEFQIYKKHYRCVACGTLESVSNDNKFENSMKKELTKWKNISLPDLFIDILRVLYNNKDAQMSAFEVGSQVDKHHLTITKAMEKLKTMGYVSYRKNTRRYYYIQNAAVETFFK